MIVLACDLGGGGLRAALFDGRGHMLALRRVDLASPAGLDGAAEADPAEWAGAFDAALGDLAREAPEAFAAVAAVAIASFTRSQVFLDARGRVLRPAILWADARAGADAPDLLSRCPADHPERGAINAFHPLARLAMLRRAEPRVAARIARVLEPKDFLSMRLSGAAIGDEVSSARLAAAAAPGPSGASLLAAAGFEAGVLPRLVPPGTIVGRVRPGLSGASGRIAGAAVVAVPHDTWASALGLGALRPGFAYNLSGTTEVLGLFGDRPAAAEGLIGIPWGEGLHHLGGPSQSGGDALAWLGGIVGAGVSGARLAELAEAPRRGGPLVFLPYLQGERTPYWDADLRGAFVGLDRAHGPGDLAFAVMEGVACLNRLVLERAEAATGIRASEIRFGGGGASGDLWPGIKADMLDRPVAAADAEPGLLGCALAALTALGAFPTLAAAQEALTAPRRLFRPRPGRRAACDALYALFRRGEAALAPISRDLARFGRA